MPNITSRETGPRSLSRALLLVATSIAFVMLMQNSLRASDSLTCRWDDGGCGNAKFQNPGNISSSGAGSTEVIIPLVKALPEAPVITVSIDTKAGDRTNPSNLRSTGMIPATEEDVPVSERRPVLVLLQDAAAEQQAERLRNRYRIISLLRPRLMVLEVDSDAVAQLRGDPNIAGVFEQEVPADVFARLRRNERMFVSAWVEQQAMGSKQRRGEGLPWDTVPFEPPDPPTGTQNP